MNFYLQPEQPTSSYSRLDSGDYELIVRQQPREALITQPGKEKNRKPIDPPPIVQLKVPEVKDPIRQFLQSPYLFMICHLEAGDPEMDAQEAKEALSGSISSSLHRLKDINNEDGGFFVFGDISVKTAGRHRLRFTLMELQKEENRVVTLRSTLSEPFNVVPPKHWRGLEESTYLSRAFSDQGVRLRLRKENRTMAQKRNYQSFQDAQPGPSSAAGDQQSGSVYNASPASSHYGFDTLPKRQRSGDYSQQAIYATAERGASGYAPREFNSSMSSVTGYPVQAAGPRQSPQTAYGFHQAAAGSNLPSYYPQGQTVPSMRAVESNTRQTQSATPGGSFAYQTGGMDTDPSEYFPRRPVELYTSIQHTPAMTPAMGSTPTDAYQGAGQTMYANPAGPATGSSAASMYQHSNMPSPMGPATGGSSTSVHTPASARGSALNPSAQPFAQSTLPSQQLPYHLQSQQLSSQQIPSQSYGSISEAQKYSYDRAAAQQYTQQQQQSMQHTTPTTLQHLTQPLPAPHQQRPPESGDPYGQHWQQYDS